MRALAKLLLGVALAGSISGCAGSFIAKPPAPEDEVARLQREVNKVRFAIDATKALIDRSRGQPYLPDLYLRLAELYVEEARYHYYIAYEGQKRRERAVTSVQARLLKNLAISVYKRILDEFTDYVDRDKVIFFIAHEHRELGEYEEMITYLKRVTDEYPNSNFANEALIVLGDYHFDKGELETAEKYYRKILASAESASHGMARYKLAWVRINKEDFKGALKLFEEAIEKMSEGELEEEEGAEKKPKEKEAKNGEGKKETASKSPIPQSGRRVDLRREALVDLVFPYTEVHKKPTAPLKYFRRLADSRISYLASLAKLANRWFVKGEYGQASNIYRELLRLGADNEDSLEWARRLYDGVIKEKEYKKVALDVEMLTGVVSRRFYDWRLGEKERAHLYEEFEAYSRDLATKANLAAEQKKDVEGFARAADAYEAYLAFFDQAPKAPEMKANMAESRYAAKQFLLAGRSFESVFESAAEAEQKEAIFNAVASYHNALKDARKLSRLDLVQARSGLKRAAKIYIDKFPTDKNQAPVKFNLARSLYDAGDFEEAAELFAALVEEFPQSEEATVSAELALDSLRARDDYEEMARLGKKLAADTRLSPQLRSDLSKIVASAESKALDTATLKAGYEGEQASEGLLEFAEKHKGDSLGERALINAFATARNSDDLDKVAAIGDQLLRDYPKSEVIPEVLTVLGKMAEQAIDFERSAKYLDEAARRKPGDPSSIPVLRAAATIKVHLGDLSGARQNFQEMLERAQPGNARRDAAIAVADMAEEFVDYAQVVTALSIAQAEGAKSADVLFRMGYALYRSGRAGEASRHFKAAAEIGATAADPEEREAAAGAAYFLSQGLADSYARIGFDGEAGQAITRKFAALGQYEAAAMGVIDLQSPRWALATLASLAAAYEQGATFLEGAPVPAGLGGDGAEKFKAALAGRAGELRGKAKEALSTCASKAAELKLFSPAAKACLAGQTFGGDPEERAAPAARRGASLPAQATELKKRIAKNSKDYEALVELAGLYLGAGDPYAAKLVLDKAAEGGADSATYNLRGVVAYQLNHPQVAFEELEQALEKDEGNVRARLNLAALYKAFGFKKLAAGEMVKVKSTAGLSANDPGLLPGALGGGK